MNTSSAYNFELFEEKPVKVKEEEAAHLKLLRKGKKEERRIKFLFINMSINTLNIIRIFIGAAFFLLILSSLIAQNITIDKLNRNIERKEEQIKTIQAESAKLQNDINSFVSLDAIDEYAVNELGFEKIQNYQVEYIDLSQNDKVILTNESLISKLQNEFLKIKDD